MHARQALGFAYKQRFRHLIYGLFFTSVSCWGYHYVCLLFCGFRFAISHYIDQTQFKESASLVRIVHQVQVYIQRTRGQKVRMAVSERLRTAGESTSVARASYPTGDVEADTKSGSSCSIRSPVDGSLTGQEAELEPSPGEGEEEEKEEELVADHADGEAAATRKRKLQPLKNPKKSLKRSKVPAPLNLSESNNSTHATNSREGSLASSNSAYFPPISNQSIKSAPAKVTQHSKFQPRVQYMGKASSRQSIQVNNNTGANYGKAPMPSAGMMTAMNPYMPMNRYIMSPYYNPYGLPPPHMANKPMMTPYGSYPYPMAPRTSVPFAMQSNSARPYEENEYGATGYRNKRVNDFSDSPLSGTASAGKPRRSEEGSGNSSVGSSANASPTRQRTDLGPADVIHAEEYHFERDPLLSANSKATSASTSMSRGRGSSSPRTREAEPDEDDEEGTDLAIEDGAVPTPTFTTFQRSLQQQQSPTLLQGEIRLSSHIFAFEFPVSSSNVDKRMFMSICNKVWNESKELAKKPSHHRKSK
ncbi:Dig1p [Saccharomyces eubayanus]|uniref:Dig1p n=1 Tax=Saccharomyces eubayanus TaxID=1080349 RepID=UPI0006C62FC0|nr:DIG1-like protein [Saccharomyces eubayanus]KOG96260.1 DIG1-like protein [Saccharomyces eubayanus]